MLVRVDHGLDPVTQSELHQHAGSPVAVLRAAVDQLVDDAVAQFVEGAADQVPDGVLQPLEAGVEEFRRGFLTADGSPLVGGDVADEAVEVEQEQIVRQKRG